MATIKITSLPSLGSNISANTVIPVVEMSATPSTEKTTMTTIANYILSEAGNLFTTAGLANMSNFAGEAGSVSNNMQPNITGLGTLANLTVEGIVNLGNVSNVVIYGGNTDQVLSTDGSGTLSWISANSLYGDSNVTSLLASLGSNNIVTTGNITCGNVNGNTNGYQIGYLNIPQVSATDANLVLADAGKHFYSTSTGNITLTIPNNSTTGFATGTSIKIVVQSTGNILVNADSGVTLFMSGNNMSGNRVVGSYGVASLLKVASDTWFIDGTGVS